jgi:hypothetical protein
MHRNAFLLVIIAMFVGCSAREASGPLGAGAMPPAILAEGWLNGTAASESELAGKVIVVDVWAYW